MTALTSPRGPLPARVYWFRRLLVLSVAFLLVFGAARLFGGSSDGSDGDVQATTAGATVETEAAEVAPTAEGTPAAEDASQDPEGPAASQEPVVEETPVPPPPPEPTGPCAGSDLVVTPTVGARHPDGRIDMVLNLRTKATPACTWQVSPDTVTVKITSGPDDIWFSHECPRAIPTQDVVVYQETVTPVAWSWSGRRSDAGCSRTTEYARVGYYHVKAAAYEGEPAEVQFELAKPAPVVKTVTVDPEPKKNKRKKPGSRPSAEPSGAVEPNDPTG